MSSVLKSSGPHAPSAADLLARAPATRDRRATAELAEQLAAALLGEAERLAEPSDHRRARKLARLLADPAGQGFTTTLTDRVFRARSALRTADQVQHLVRRWGLPKFLSPLERVELALAANLARPAAPAVARGVLAQVQRESRDLVLDQENVSLTRALGSRRRGGIAVNVNQLGEALLGERDAEARVLHYCELARRTDVDALSVKVSSLASWLSPLAFDADRRRVSARLTTIYEAALRSGGARGPVVMLDMESYDDVELTLAVLESALAACPGVRAGVVLQAYLPDSHRHLERVLKLALARRESGLSALRVRLVKGANLAFERVEAARRGLAMPTFPDKLSTDASYKLLLEQLVTRGLGHGVELGVASHNVFDLAYALVLRARSAAPEALSLEMLEGMATPLLRALVALHVPVLSYVPICADDALVNGIAYLVRRLDENTSPDNFLRRSFDMHAGDAAFALERARFRAALAAMETLSLHSARRAPPAERAPHLRGEPDTDFAQPEARALARASIDTLLTRAAPVLHSESSSPLGTPAAVIDGFDPSRPSTVPYRIALLAAQDVDAMLSPLHADARGYGKSTLAERSALLGRVAQALREARTELVAAMVMDAGKRVLEADAEVSEAIDFAEYYRRSFRTLAQQTAVAFSPRGVVLVAPPWNFPLGIPAGSVFAALMAGNRVLLKPALETVYVAQQFVSLAHRAGVPRDVLALVLCDDDVASEFVRDPRVSTVVLTGATSTARLLQRIRPGLHLAAETGGKNPYLISAMSDHEQAIRDAVSSAFGHAGQKCSATSLLILEAELYDDPRFMATLEDAVRSLKVGPASALDSFVTPLIAPPSGPLAQSLSKLGKGERWLVEPQHDPENARLLSPGVKLGITPDSHDYRSELFGPVLGVMRADSFAHALALANGTAYGLTAGLASLDEREQALFLAQMRAGNLYVNRPTTGAIVERQPFGGYDDSSFGSGAKAGGPNYVARLARWHEPRVVSSNRALPAWLAARIDLLAQALSPADRSLLRARAGSYVEAERAHFARVHDPHAVLGQHNTFRYRARPRVLIRAAADALVVDLLASVLAAELAEAAVVLSFDPAYRGEADAGLLGFPVYVETAETLCTRADMRHYVRMVGTRERVLDRLSAEHGAHLADEPVLSEGRLELLHYVEEQSLSVETHRHGYLGPAQQRGDQAWK